MWVLLPSLLLVITLLALVAVQRWRPAFKSYWFVATVGALLAALVTLSLRFSLPLAAHFPGWHLGDGLEFPLNFSLDAFSWPLAAALLVLLLSNLLRSVRRASAVSWPIWMPSLALAAAALLAVAAGDLLAVALTLFLLDVLLFALHSAVAPEEERGALLEQLALTVSSVVLALAAWATPPSYASLAAALLVLAGAVRLAVAAGPRRGTRQSMPAFASMLYMAPLAATLVLLQHVQPLSGIVLHLGLALVLGVALRWAIAALATDAPAHLMQLGLAALALASAMAGVPSAVLGFGLLLLFSSSLAQLVGHYPVARRPLVAAGAILFSGLWFTAVQGTSALYVAPSSPLVYAVLPVHAVLLLALLQRAASPTEPPAPDEPWTLAVESIGAVLPLAILFVLGLVMPLPYGGNSAPWWPALAVLLLLAAVWAGRSALQRTGRRLLPPHLRLPRLQVPAPRRVAAALSAALAAVLRLLNSLLEGEAGLLWALLLIALLISVFSQGGLAG
ncbi:MAG: hypothetical protein KIS88_05105 [Anaerolineales bacterium]|nr:hypothetical protein [Anaerolineales bacterium]